MIRSGRLLWEEYEAPDGHKRFRIFNEAMDEVSTWPKKWLRFYCNICGRPEYYSKNIPLIF